MVSDLLRLILALWGSQTELPLTHLLHPHSYWVLNSLLPSHSPGYMALPCLLRLFPHTISLVEYKPHAKLKIMVLQTIIVIFFWFSFVFMIPAAMSSSIHNMLLLATTFKSKSCRVIATASGSLIWKVSSSLVMDCWTHCLFMNHVFLMAATIRRSISSVAP